MNFAVTTNVVIKSVHCNLPFTITMAKVCASPAGFCAIHVYMPPSSLRTFGIVNVLLPFTLFGA